MTAKWFGASLIILGCGSFGFSLAAGKRKEEQILKQLLLVLNYLECELQYHLTPLPQLCCQVSGKTVGTVKEVFLKLAEELESHSFSDVAGCMESALFFNVDIPFFIREILYELGRTLGSFDLPGQIQSLHRIQETCEWELSRFRKNREERLRSYQTLGVCAGAALVIIFI